MRGRSVEERATSKVLHPVQP